MTREEAKELLVRRVTELQGVKATELICDPEVLLLVMLEELVTTPALLLEELVREGRLVEIEYVLKELDDRIKSFYLPSGTEVTVSE